MDKLRKEWKSPQLLVFGKVADLTKVKINKDYMDPGDGVVFQCKEIGVTPGCSVCPGG